MSEYQYFEFAAIDEPLNEKQMAELRAISTRAEITPTRFWNEYQWGHFKGDPRKMVAEYFDAFIHYANWGTLWCMFRLPKEAVDLAAMKRFAIKDAIGIIVKGKHVIIDLHFEDEPGDYETPYDQTLGPLLTARQSLLDGDLGPLYVAWLAAVQRKLVDDDEREPCDVSQLAPLDGGKRALAEFLCVDPALLKAAYQPAQKRLRVDPPAAVVKWVQSLPPKEKDTYLAQFVAEPANVVRARLLKQYREAQRPNDADQQPFEPRMVARLLSSMDQD